MHLWAGREVVHHLRPLIFSKSGCSLPCLSSAPIAVKDLTRETEYLLVSKISRKGGVFRFGIP